MHHILIVEDIPETAKWLTETTRQAFEHSVITQTRTYLEAVNFINKSTINLALLDINLPDGCGIQLTPLIKKFNPDAYIVITTIFDDDEHILRALKMGANGYLLKDLPDQIFIQKLRGILNGDPPISPSISRKILQHFVSLSSPKQPNDPPTESPSLSLSLREKEVLILIAKGFSRNEIAQHLTISSNTVARYIRDVYQKLNISSRAEAALEACRLKLVNPN